MASGNAMTATVIPASASWRRRVKEYPCRRLTMSSGVRICTICANTGFAFAAGVKFIVSRYVSERW